MGLRDVDALVRDPGTALRQRVTRVSHEASGTLAPTTLGDEAALGWRRADAGAPQTQVAQVRTLRWRLPDAITAS